MKQVNLTEILSQFVLEVSGVKIITISAALQAMKEACNQTVDLCYENAKAEYVFTESFDRLTGEDINVFVNQPSILNTKKQII